MRAVETQLRWLLRDLDPWLADPRVTDIYVNRPREVFVERYGEQSRYAVPTLRYETLADIAINAAALSRQSISEDRPLCLTHFPDKQRVQLVAHPATTEGCLSLSIRRPPDSAPTIDDLEESGVFAEAIASKSRISESDAHLLELYRSGPMRTFLEAAVRGRKNVAFVGRVGSGKTYNLRAFTHAIPQDCRIVTIEDMPEILNLPQPNVVHLYYSKGGQGVANVTAEDLVEASLRMGMDWLLQQELRDAAALAYLRVLASGHPAMTTWHADSAEDAFNAVLVMVKQHPAGRHLDNADVMQMLRRLIDVVVYCEKQLDGKRRIKEVWFDPEAKLDALPSKAARALAIAE